MLVDYIHAALAKARFEKTKDREPFYGEIPGLKGVWATGKTLKGCRTKLAEVLEGWLMVRLRKNLPIPGINGVTLKGATRMKFRTEDEEREYWTSHDSVGRVDWNKAKKVVFSKLQPSVRSSRGA